jgi:hypothetical protein
MPTVNAASYVAKNVQGLDTGHVNKAQGIELVWREILEAAANQGRLRALVDVVLADQTVAAYHQPIRDALAPPGAPTGGGAAPS